LLLTLKPKWLSLGYLYSSSTKMPFSQEKIELLNELGYLKGKFYALETETVRGELLWLFKSNDAKKEKITQATEDELFKIITKEEINLRAQRTRAENTDRRKAKVEEIRNQSLTRQREKLETYFTEQKKDNGPDKNFRDIVPSTSVFLERKNEEIDNGIVGSNLQLMFSDPKDFIKINYSNFEKDNHAKNRYLIMEYLDKIVIDPAKLSQELLKKLKLIKKDQKYSDLELMQIAGEKVDEFKDLFKDIIPIGTYNFIFFNNGENKGKMARFSTQKILKEGKYDRVKTMSIFEDGYSASREFQHIIDSENQKMNKYKGLIESFSSIRLKIKDPEKREEAEREIKSLIAVIEKARSFKIASANVKNLQEVDFSHPERDFQRITWGLNKLMQRMNEIGKIILEVSMQEREFKKAFSWHEINWNLLYWNLKDFEKNNKTDRNFAISINRYFKYYKTNNFIIKPFCDFHDQLQKGLGEDILKSIQTKKNSLIRRMHSQNKTLEAYRKEHNEKKVARKKRLTETD